MIDSLLKPSMKLIAAGTVLLLSQLAQAKYVVADYMNKGFDPSKRTHVLVAAKGTDMGLQFHMSAASQARKILDVNPNDQVVLIAVLDDGKGWLVDESNERRLETSLMVFNIINQKNEKDMKRANDRTKFYQDVEEGTKLVLAQWGFTNIREVNQNLDGMILINELSRYSKVASLNIYSHSNSYYGLLLSGPTNRLDPNDADAVEKIKHLFTEDAYAWFHGCNNSIIGMKFTSRWGIPVATSFTSTAFQEMFKTADGKFSMIHDYAGNIPVGAKRIGVNTVSFKKPQECLKVPCVRMMPDNYGYGGYWGNYKDGGLGFYKFNCSKSISAEKCKMAMARGLVNHVSTVYTDYNSDLDTFKKSAQDYLCPTGAKYVKKGYTYEACAQSLEKSLSDSSVELDTFMTKSLQCSRSSCEAAIKCEAIRGVKFLLEKSCSLTNRRDMKKPISTQVNEYRDLVEGFMLMKQQMSQQVNQ